MLLKTIGSPALIAAVAFGSYASWATNLPETANGEFAGARQPIVYHKVSLPTW